MGKPWDSISQLTDAGGTDNRKEHHIVITNGDTQEIVASTPSYFDKFAFRSLVLGDRIKVETAASTVTYRITGENADGGLVITPIASSAILVQGALIEALNGLGMLPAGTQSGTPPFPDTSLYGIDTSVDPQLLKVHDGSGSNSAGNWVAVSFEQLWGARYLQAETYAAARALVPAAFDTSVLIQGNAAANDGGGGTFYIDHTDSVAADDGAKTLVTASGKRLKRVYKGLPSVAFWGSNDAALTSALAAEPHLLIDKNVTLSGAVNVGTGKTLKFVNGAIIDGAGTLAMSPRSNIDAEPFQIFGASLTVTNLRLVHPEWFGAARDGSTDDRTAITRALGSLAVNGTCHFESGIYNWDGDVYDCMNGQRLVGAGKNATQFNFQNATDSFIRFADGGTRGWEVRHVGFRSEVDMTTGVIIDIADSASASQDATIENIEFRDDNVLPTLIAFRDDVQKVSVRDIVATNFKTGFLMEDCLNITVSEIQLDGNSVAGSVGVDLVGSTDGGGIEAVMFSDGIIANCDTPLRSRGDSAARGSGIFGCDFERIWFDDAKATSGLDIECMNACKFEKCRGVSSAVYGAWVKNSVAVEFDHCQFDKNVNHGIRIESDAVGIVITGGSARDNDDNTLGGVAGIWVEGGADSFRILGVDCRGQTGVFDKEQAYGIDIGGGCTNFIVKNNDCRGNITTSLRNNAGTSATQIVNDNLV